MSCDFKPGDEVVCVDSNFEDFGLCCGTPDPVVGDNYIVADVFADDEGVWVCLIGFDGLDFLAVNFRKVQKRNDRLTIEAFSVIKDGGFEEPKRAPAKKRERA